MGDLRFVAKVHRPVYHEMSEILSRILRPVRIGAEGGTSDMLSRGDENLAHVGS